MNISHKLNHSYPFIKYYARTMCTKIHHSRSNISSKQSNNSSKGSKRHRMITYPQKYSSKYHDISEEQRNLMIDKIITQTNKENVLYSEDIDTRNAYISNLIIDMVYTTYCETGQGIALFDTQFNMKWKKFIVRKFSKILSEEQLTPFIENLSILPSHLSNYTQRIKHFIHYEYDRISFKKPVSIFPSDAFIIAFNEHSNYSQHNNTSHKMHNKRNPYIRRNKIYEYNEQELYYRINYLFEKSKSKNGLYLHEISDVFQSEHNSILSLKTNPNMFEQKGVEHLALNPLFDSYYESKDCFTYKISLQKLLENAGCLHCYNKHISRVMIFPNTSHGRFQHALLNILKNDDYLYTFKFIKTKLKEYYVDLYNEINYDK
eukprot:372787_1